MDFQVKSAALENIDADVLVCAISEKGKPLVEVGEVLSAFIARQDKAQNLPREKGDTALFVEVDGIAAERLLLVCQGESLTDKEQSARQAATLVQKRRWRSLLLAVAESIEDQVAVARQLAASVYRFTAFKSDKQKAALTPSVTFSVARKEVKALQEELRLIQAWALGTALTRDLGNTPANVCTPKYLGRQAEKLGKAYADLQVEVLKQKAIKDLGMGALLAVAQGSAAQPRFIIMNYKPKKAVNAQPIVLVGKGVTFDSGGISLKPAANMDEMKYDMGGAAAVFGTMKALCEAGLPLHVVGLVPAVENMPDGGATRPGDIVTSLSSKTIEILNTDAEGRLILCDALTYAERYKPQAVIDMATLTGACVVALGAHRAGLLGNDDNLKQALFDAGERARDPVWCLPLDDEYKALLKSPFADLKNIGGREAGTITAAAFLSAFAENYSWAHLDIAGVAWQRGDKKGGTGRPVGLLLEYLRRQSKK